MSEEKRKKPGFFSRLFDLKHVEAPEEETEGVVSAAEAPVDQEAPVGETLQPIEVPEAESAEEVPEETAEPEKRGVFGRWFGRKEAPAEAPEAEESIAKEPEAPEEPAEEEVPAAAASEEKASWFKRLSSRLGKTRKGLYDRVRSVVGLSGKLDEETIEEIEAILIQSDVAVETTQKIIDRMRAAMRSRDKEGSKESTVILDVFKEAIQDLIISGSTGFEPKRPEEGPYVVMIVGVNGVGKTTTIAKMAKRCTDVGLKTMLVAGDTFRAAAVEQLEEWARRIGCEFVKAAPNSDAAALCFDAMNKAKTREMDVVFIDTAGRLHTKSTLMAELGKIDRVIDKQLPGAPHETLLVIDATTGQNVIQQVKTFKAAVDISGLVMTKLDGTAKGGILITLLDMFKIPVTLIGVGEQAEDLRDFDPEQFAHALFADEPTK